MKKPIDQDWFGTLVALVSSLVLQDLYKIGQALANLSDLNQQVKGIYKMR